MASGSYLNRGEKDALGTRPGHMMAWDKLQLGWLNYEVAQAGERSTHRVGPAEYNTKAAQALITVLPDRERTTEVNAPFAGRYEWWSGSGDNLNNTLSRTVDLAGRSQASVAMKAWYDIEAGYDYLYAEVSEDGTNWTALDGTANGQPIGDDGVKPALSGSSNGEWVDLAYDLTPYAGERAVPAAVRHGRRGCAQGVCGRRDRDHRRRPARVHGRRGGRRGRLDGGRVPEDHGLLHGVLPQLLHRREPPVPRLRQDLEDRPVQLRHRRERRPLPVPERPARQLLEHGVQRQQRRRAPGRGAGAADRLAPEAALAGERDALAHPGAGLRRAVRRREDGQALPAHDGGIQSIPSQPAVRTFDDRRPYWYASDPDAGVKVPNTGTTISVKGQSNGGSFMQVEVRPAR